MTDFVHTSSEAARSWSSSPLIVIRDFFNHPTWAPFQMGRAQLILCGCHCIYFWYIIFITYAVCASILLPLRVMWPLVCCLYKEVYLYRLNACPFYYKHIAHGKVRTVDRLTTPVEWLQLLKLTVLSLSAIALHKSNFYGVFCDVTLPFDISVGIWAFVIGPSQIPSLSFSQLIWNNVVYICVRSNKWKEKRVYQPASFEE